MRTSWKILGATSVTMMLIGGGVVFYLKKQERVVDYYVPVTRQALPDSVVGEGTTVFATPEKVAAGSQFGEELYGNGIKVTITPRVTSEGVIVIRFTGITEYVAQFPPEFVNHLLSTIDEFDAAARRVREQQRLTYQQKLTSIRFWDIGGVRREIPIYLRSTPARRVIKGGVATDEGQAIYLRMELPFRLEDITNFRYTDVRIPESGVHHLRDLLGQLTKKLKNKHSTA